MSYGELRILLYLAYRLTGDLHVCFRVTRELEAVRQEALLLQDQMKTIKHDIQKVGCLTYSRFTRCNLYFNHIQ